MQPTFNKHPKECGEMEVSEKDMGDAHHHTGIKKVMLKQRKQVKS